MTEPVSGHRGDLVDHQARSSLETVLRLRFDRQPDKLCHRGVCSEGTDSDRCGCKDTNRDGETKPSRTALTQCSLRGCGSSPRLTPHLSLAATSIFGSHLIRSAACSTGRAKPQFVHVHADRAPDDGSALLCSP